jgi:hypothetical protein
MKMNELELLSAFIDGELSPEERMAFEQKMKLSPELRKKYEEMVRVKDLTREAIKKIPENPYLETRIMTAIKEEKGFLPKYRKFLPAAGIAIVTLILMLLLKLNPHLIDEIVEQQKTNIAGFYQQNLKPLLTLNQLSKEELFNFAFYHEIPIDKENNRFLKLGYKENGAEFFEIKNASNIEPANNLEKFVTALNLNETQKNQVDSILNTYNEDLQMQVLVNDMNTLAINPKIWDLRKAMAADLYAFASSASHEALQRVMPEAARVNPVLVARGAREFRKGVPREFIFVTPDSIFHEDLVVDLNDLKEDLKKMKLDIERDTRGTANENDKIKKVKPVFTYGISIDSSIIKLYSDAPRDNNKYRVLVNGNDFKVEFNESDFPKVQMPDFDKISAEIEKATNGIKYFTFQVPTTPQPPDIKEPVKGAKGRDYNYNYRFNDSTFRVNVNVPNVDSILKVQKIVIDSLNRLNKLFNSFGNEDMMIKIDSLTSSYKFFMGNDSLVIFNGREFKEEMQRMQNELREFRNEIYELQRGKRDSMKTEKKRVIEI